MVRAPWPPPEPHLPAGGEQVVRALRQVPAPELDEATRARLRRRVVEVAQREGR